MMGKTKAKLMATATMLLISVVLLAGASLAWFTISTNPEISGMQVILFTDRALVVSKTPDQEDFTQSIDLSEMFMYYAPLKPISTVDGKHWFMPTYDEETGLLNPVSEFLLATEENANVLVYNMTDAGEYIEMTEKEYLAASDKGYYVYCEFYLATEYEEDVRVTLSAPDREKNNLEAWEWNPEFANEHSYKYGSYALAAYEKDPENGKLYSIDNNAQTALRVGFLIEDEAAEGATGSRFVIYEPNADQRSDFSKKPFTENGKTDFYIHQYNLIPNTNYTEGGTEPKFLNYVPNSYIPTVPVGPKTLADGTVVGELTPIADEDLIVQLAGQWKYSSVQSKIMNGQGVNSNDVEFFGKFVDKTSSVTKGLNQYGIHEFGTQTGYDLASDTMIVTLKGRNSDGTLNPTKIKMFIWLEGQDPDCWNDIAGGSFMVNLEFAAQP